MKRMQTIFMVLLMMLNITGCNWLVRPPDRSPAQSSAGQASAQDLVDEIAAAAKNGKVPGEPYIAGKTVIGTIEKSWGSAHISRTQSGIYADYAQHNVVFGYYRQSPVFDVRSYNKKLTALTLQDVKQAMGKPDNVTSYDAGKVHQQILVYRLGSGLELKWVMPRPDSKTSDPHIDHISVYDVQTAEHSLAAEAFRMPLEEKIGQMLMVGISGVSPGEDANVLIKQDHVGGVILYGFNIKSAAQTVKFTNQLKSMNADAGGPAPLFMSVDEEGGEVDRMPSPILKMPSNEKVGEIGDPGFSNQVGQVIGEELQRLGFNMDYAPVLDVKTDPVKSVIGSRSFGSKADAVSRLGTATMEGIQSQNVISVIKHFPGYGSIGVDAHKDLPSISYGLDQLQKRDWVPYRNAIAHGADAVMVTHLLVPKLNTRYPASMSPKIITGMLRGKLGFQGVIMTDDMTMGAIENHYDIKSAAVQAVQAGADIVMVAFHQNQQEEALRALKQAVENGTLSEQRIDDSVYRILRLKSKYKISDRQAAAPDVSRLNQDIRKVLEQKLKVQ